MESPIPNLSTQSAAESPMVKIEGLKVPFDSSTSQNSANSNPDENAGELFMTTLQSHIDHQSSQTIDDVRRYFSIGRKFSNYQKHEFNEKPEALSFKTGCDQYDCNPFSVPADHFKLDLLTDSGTGRLTDEQNMLSAKYKKLVPSIENFSYARCTPREHLEAIFQKCFGDQFNYYPALQGRAAERMLLHAFLENGILKEGDRIVSNRPFDTTKGHIMNLKLNVSAKTPLSSPESYYESDTVFMGNINEEIFDIENHELFLMTMTDNGGGGQPVSMENFKRLADKSHAQGKLVWVDGCRIYENALFIKAFEQGYENKTLNEITKEILSLCDASTLSFKKMYAHCGGGILINKDSKILNAKLLKGIDFTIKRMTTTDYGNGYRSYSGLTGDGMIEMMTGLMCVVDEEICGKRISQVGHVGNYLKQTYGFPIISGGHALYIAADQVLPNVPLVHCPAEYLNAMMMKTIQTRGCGLGYMVYGGRVTENGITKYNNHQTMDSLRLAIPRNEYTAEQMISYLSIIGEAFARGNFKEMKGGLTPIDFVDTGFYHFGGSYNIIDDSEFDKMCELLKEKTCTK